MSIQNQHQEEVRKVIDDLIQTATTYDTEKLDHIYHDQLKVVMIDIDDNVNTGNKQDFIGLFQSKKEAGDPPMNTWAKYHRVEVEKNNAYVLLSRKNNLTGADMVLTLSIDLVFEDERWQVLREVIFLRPKEHS